MTSKPIMLMLVALFVQQSVISNIIRDGHSMTTLIFGVLSSVIAALAILIAWME